MKQVFIHLLHTPPNGLPTPPGIYPTAPPTTLEQAINLSNHASFMQISHIMHKGLEGHDHHGGHAGHGDNAGHTDQTENAGLGSHAVQTGHTDNARQAANKTYIWLMQVVVNISCEVLQITNEINSIKVLLLLQFIIAIQKFISGILMKKFIQLKSCKS